MKIIANGIRIEVEDSADGLIGADSFDENGFDASSLKRPVVLLIMGLGMQLIAWPDAFVQGLVDAGFRVVRFDNRDVGLSQHFDELGKPALLWTSVKHRLGWRIDAPYSLNDMAADALGVLDALKIDQAHVVGASMGGMIAQRLALLAPARVQSLTSVMSSSGARGLPDPHPSVLRVLMSPPGASASAAIARSVRLYQAIASPGFPIDADVLRQLATTAIERAFHPEGTQRQMVAVVADSTRASALAGLAVPTLVVHGRADRLIPFPAGEDTARRIPGARLVGIEGMGHDLAPGVVARLLPLMVSHFRQAA